MQRRPGLFYSSREEAEEVLGKNIEKIIFEDPRAGGNVFDSSVKNNPLNGLFTTLDIAKSFNKSKKIAADEFNLKPAKKSLFPRLFAV